MLSRSGWFTAATGVGLIIGGRIFGLIELFILGGAALGLVGLAILWLLIRPRSVELQRVISSARLYAGDSSQVQVRVHNRGALPSPVLRITDDVAGTRGAELELPPLRRRDSRVVGYQLPTERRGVVEVGPLRTHLIDPFGLVHGKRDVAGLSEVLVYPHIDEVPPPPRPPGDDSRFADRQANQVGRSSDEFFALRQYVVGDDLRRVHWPSTARFDDVMIRQDELPQQGRTTILLDTRRGSTKPEVFEAMVSAAASLAVAARKRDDLVRLVGTEGTDTGFTPASVADPILDYLAMVEQQDAGEIDRAAVMVAQGNPGSIVAIASVNSGGAPMATEGIRQRAINATVLFGAENARPLGSAVALPSQLMVRVTPSQEFRDVWTQAIGLRSATSR